MQLSLSGHMHILHTYFGGYYATAVMSLVVFLWDTLFSPDVQKFCENIFSKRKMINNNFLFLGMSYEIYLAYNKEDPFQSI